MVVCASGSHHSLFLDPLGTVWSCGNNENGRLGLGDEKHRYVPEPIINLPKIISAIALGGSSIFLDCEGSVWACGYNKNGELGLGHARNGHVPEKIGGLHKIKSIAGGWHHSLFLDSEGSVWACGYNTFGQLGLGDTRNRHMAEKIGGLPKIKLITGGWHWSMLMDEAGNVWVCGGNKKGELGLGHTIQIHSPIVNKNLFGVVAVAGGLGNYSVFLDKAGNIFTCGSNEDGQLGLGDKKDRHTPQKVNNIPPISSLSCCNAAVGYMQIVDEEGRVWSCGNNGHGQLGLAHRNQTLAFQLVKQPHKERAAIKAAEQQKEEEKQLFKSIEQEQNEQLMDKIKSGKHLHNVNKQQAKQKIIDGG